MASLSEFTPKYLRLEMVEDIVIVGIGVELLTEDVNLEHFGHELFALVEQFGCRRVVVNLQEAVADVLTTSRLITYLQVCPDVPAALAALEKAK